jgi:hypothetical protein
MSTLTLPPVLVPKRWVSQLTPSSTAANFDGERKYTVSWTYRNWAWVAL